MRISGMPLPSAVRLSRPAAKLAVLCSAFALVVAYYISGLLITATSKKNTPECRAKAAMAKANRAWSTGHLADADQLFARAYDDYAQEICPAVNLFRVCKSRAEINLMLGNIEMASRFRQQAAEFKKLEERQENSASGLAFNDHGNHAHTFL